MKLNRMRWLLTAIAALALGTGLMIVRSYVEAGKWVDAILATAYWSIFTGYFIYMWRMSSRFARFHAKALRHDARQHRLWRTRMDAMLEECYDIANPADDGAES